MNVQWYPGHMTKARRMMQEDIKLVDLVIELLDARAPMSSRNPDIAALAAGKSRVVLLNKADLADEKQNRLWAGILEKEGAVTSVVNARSGSGLKDLGALVQQACREKIERDRRRGIKNRPVRAMVVGIPNVGKSTFINSYAGKAVAKTGNKPGVTKGKQWIRLSREVELLDTPGILWPKFEDETIGIRLALIGSIRDEILQTEDLAVWLLNFLRENYPGMTAARYQGADESLEAADLLMQIAQLRGCIKKGGEADTERAAAMLIDDLRSGRIGRITLDRITDEI